MIPAEPVKSDPTVETAREQVEAEDLWESLGGDLCICQRADVSHWCEKCQQRIGFIKLAFAAVRSDALQGAFTAGWSATGYPHGWTFGPPTAQKHCDEAYAAWLTAQAHPAQTPEKR